MMKRRAQMQGPAAVLAAVMMAGSVSAQTPQTPQTAAPPAGQTTPQGLGSGQLPVDKYVVGTAKPPQVPGSAPIDLTLDQSIQIALDHNLSLQVARLNPQIQDYAIQGAQDVFVPQINGTYSYTNATQPSTNTTEGVATTITTTNRYNASLNQTVPWFGGNYSVGFNNSGQITNNKTLTRNPSYSSSLAFTYTQPVWSNLKIDANRANIITNQIQRQIVDIQLLATIENTKATVRSSYWSLKGAVEKIEISRRALDLAQQLLDNDKTQVQIGTMAEIDTAQPLAQVYSAQATLLAAQIAWQQADLSFKQLLVGGKDDELFKKTINPIDIPAVGAEPQLNIDGAVQKALVDRTDIQQAKKSLESSDVSLRQSVNLTKPQLNLSGGFTNSGLGGPTTSDLTNNYFDALSSVLGFTQPTWQFSTNFVYQLGMKTQKANLARAQISLDQQKAQLKVTELSVVTDVTTAGLNVQNTYKQYIAAQQASTAQEAATVAEQTRFTVGLSNNFNVVTQQNNLTTARLAELNALISYVNAVADYERKQRIGGGGSSTTGSTTTTGGS